MNEFADLITRRLLKSICEAEDDSRNFVKNPEKDFTRKRKLGFSEMVRIILSMGGKSLNLELLDYFSYDTGAASCSAFVQQRGKLLPELFEKIFKEFTASLPKPKKYKGYRLLAADGSDLNIAYNPDDKDTYHSNGAVKGCNLLHLNAIYDLCNKTFVDVVTQTHKMANEQKSLIGMIEQSTLQDRVLLVMDRGYENYNLIEHISRKGWYYAIRVKDINSNGIASGLPLPSQESFDVDYSLLLTRKQTKKIKANNDLYKFMPVNQIFDFLPPSSKDVYPMNFRLVRFAISDDLHEVIITNLDRNEFPPEKIKEIYHMRWGIETSFRELKYALGLENFHSKKVAYIMQEVFARLIMYNFCETITMNVIIGQENTQHIYQVNFTIAIAICLRYFRCRGDTTPPNVEALIRKNILPVRPGRKDPRKVRTKSTVSFLYRVA
jgi:hypothetical protein